MSARLDSVEIIAQRGLPSSRFAAVPDTSFDHIISWLQLPALSVNALGSSGLTTLSNRGMSSRHTAILFEGLPINGITTGVVDVSILPKHFFNQALLFKEGLSSYAGNQTMGGALSLQHRQKAENEYASSVQFTSTRNLTLSQLWQASVGKASWSVGWERTRDQNQQDYSKDGKLKTSPPFVKFGNNVNGELTLDLGKNHRLTFKSWWQDFEREIPGPFYLPVNQFQQDKNWRSVLSHNWQKANWQLVSSLGYFNESINYQSPGIDSRAKTMLINANATALYKQRWQLALTMRTENAKANFYGQNRSRSSMLLSVTRKWKLQHGWINVAMAPHLVNGKWMPLHADLRIDWKGFQLAAIRNYNLPGFNDLYWPSGGNPNLKTEKSFQLSANQLWQPNHELQIKTALFSYHVSDLIQWIPANNNLWTPVNRKKVWSRGGELNLEYRPNWLPFSTLLAANYGFTKATNMDESAGTSQGKQLIYVPLHKAGWMIKSEYSVFHFSANLLYLGKRFDTTDNFLSLPPAWITHANVGAKFKFNKWQMVLDYRIENPGQAQYELVRSFPMPLRYHTFFIQLKYTSS